MKCGLGTHLPGHGRAGDHPVPAGDCRLVAVQRRPAGDGAEFVPGTRSWAIQKGRRRRVSAPAKPGQMRPGQVLAIVCAGIVLANLDLFIVNVALPDIARDFGNASLSTLSWILNGYAIVYAALLVFCGRLAERYPRNYSFLAGIALFTAASAACEFANSVETLVGFRLLQAAGAALLTPTSLGLILATFPAERRAE